MDSSPAAPPVHYALELRSKRRELANVWSFEFARSDWFDFIAGQYVHLRLAAPVLEKPVHHMSLASAPGDELVQFTMLIRPESPYKQAIAALEPGDAASLFKVKGEFVLPDPLEPGTQLVMLAGGIGITPFRSILRAAHRQGLALDSQLLHVSRDGWLFADELAGLLPPGGQHLLVREALPRALAAAAAARPEALYYIAGSPSFVFGQQAALQVLGISEERIRLDNFKAYDELE
jgi:ferredoxin-NADP reductase